MQKWLVEVYQDGQELNEAPDVSTECDTEDEANATYNKFCEDYPNATVIKRVDRRKVLYG